MVFNTLTAAQYTGATKTNAEAAYGAALGIYVSGTGYKTGASVASAIEVRRAAAKHTVTFTVTVAKGQVGADAQYTASTIASSTGGATATAFKTKYTAAQDWCKAQTGFGSSQCWYGALTSANLGTISSVTKYAVVAPAGVTSSSKKYTTGVTITQAVTYDDMTIAQYTGNVKTAAELGYGISIGIWASAQAYITGASVTSTASRRAGATVNFKAVVPSAKATAAAAAAAGLTATQLAAGVTKANQVNSLGAAVYGIKSIATAVVNPNSASSISIATGVTAAVMLFGLFNSQ
jgi:hypothetical protein